MVLLVSAVAGPVRVMVRSGCSPMVMTVATAAGELLLVSLLSAMVLAGSTVVSVAALVTVVATAGAVTVTVSTAGVAIFTVPPLKVTVPPACVALKLLLPMLLDRYVVPAGMVKVVVTPVALASPPLFTVML